MLLGDDLGGFASKRFAGLRHRSESVKLEIKRPEKQRVHTYYYYGIKSQKTILMMVLGT